MDIDETAALVPVAEWVYDLYKVSLWTEEGGRLIKEVHIAASSENHLVAEANEAANSMRFNECGWYSWETVKENVGQPRIVGSMYGFNVYETGQTHGERLAQTA